MQLPENDAEAGRLSRRSVLGAAGAGAAGLTVAAFAGPALAGPRPAAAAGADHQSRTPTQDPASTADVDHVEDVVVHLRSVRTGELDVFHGTTHVRLTDRDLAARLARASK